MFLTSHKSGNPFQRICVRGINRTGSTLLAGEAVKLDLGTTAAAPDTDTLEGGGPGNQAGSGDTAAPAPYAVNDAIFCNFLTPAVGTITDAQIIGVVTDLLGNGGVDNSEMEVCIQGVVQTTTASTAWVRGVTLMTQASRVLLATADAAGTRPVAFLLTTATTTTPTVFLYGWGGMVGDGLT